jgi:hypothetical protein
MNTSEATTNGRSRLRRRNGETPPDFQSRLASCAMERGQIDTLQRYLDEGMSPDTLFHTGWGGGGKGAGPWTLIEWAARCGYFECFKVLEAAGARISDLAITNAIEDDRDRSVLDHLLATGAFDPNGLRQDGWTWIDYVNRWSSSEGKSALAWAISEREQAELSSTTHAAAPTRQRRFL